MTLLYEFLITSIIFMALFIFYASGAFMVLLPIAGLCIVLKVISHMPFMKKYYEASTKNIDK